jgi:hypothetical protein
MKKLFLALGLCFLFQARAHAFQTAIWLSSNTATAQSTSTLCGQYISNGTTTTLHGVLHGVCVNTAAAGNIQVFNSTYTSMSNSLTGVYSTATQEPCNFYDATAPNGLMFLKVGTGDVSILYQCY